MQKVSYVLEDIANRKFAALFKKNGQVFHLLFLCTLSNCISVCCILNGYIKRTLKYLLTKEVFAACT